MDFSPFLHSRGLLLTVQWSGRCPRAMYFCRYGRCVFCIQARVKVNAAHGVLILCMASLLRIGYISFLLPPSLSFFASVACGVG